MPTPMAGRAIALSERRNLWQGKWVNDDDVSQRIDQLDIVVGDALEQTLNVDTVLEACEKLSTAISDPKFANVSNLLSRDLLQRRLRQELSTDQPDRLTRKDPRAILFEAWAPRGLIVHLTSSPFQTVISAVEGLLTGNVNLIFAPDPPLSLMATLGELDPTGQIARRLAVLHDSAEHDQWRRLACASADCVASWEQPDISSYLPPGCRLVRRDDKTSIAYITSSAWLDERYLAALALEVCRSDRPALKAIFLDTDLAADVQAFAERFRPLLAETTHVRIDRLPRNRLMSTLRPMRPHLWTAHLAGEPNDVAELSRIILASGARRVSIVGAIADGTYYDEPNDGSQPLREYSRRISAHADERFATNARLDEIVPNGLTPLSGPAAHIRPGGPVLTKAEAKLRTLDIPPQYAQLYFHSGGSTGAPAVSAYTYEDYDDNTRATAYGLLAAGLDPRIDRAAILFHSGMGGGQVSFFEALERLTVTQVPVGADTAFPLIVATLIQHNVNAILGMPSYLWRLCRQEQASLRSYGRLRKIFYTGEHISAEQRHWLQDELDLEVIRSAAYTTTDLGPLGYQCTYATGTIHHLHHDLHTLEILDLEADRPTESGRLVFTRNTRRGQNLDRYEIGDIGRWVYGVCDCRRQNPRFELLGRRGDIVRVGARFINYRRLEEIAQEELSYVGEVQVVIDFDGDRERLTLRLDEKSAPDLESVRRALVTNYHDLHLSVETDELLSLIVEAVDPDRLHRTPGGKLRAVVDLRSRS